jgi:ketosteroid isomerase-like protein
MATRRKSKTAGRKRGVRKATPRKPAPSRKRAGANKPRKALRKKAARGRAAPSRKPLARKAARAPGAESALEALAKRIIRATQGEVQSLTDLYTPDCVSQEPAGEPARGHRGIEDKLAWWNQQQSHTEWTPRRVFTSNDSICIEWDARVHLRDGRVVPFSEVAVHEIRGGRIARERYYYDPGQLGPPQAARAVSAPTPELTPRRFEDGGSDVDPLDL